MNTTWVSIEGIERPFMFSSLCAYQYERAFGRPYAAAIYEVQKQFSAVYDITKGRKPSEMPEGDLLEMAVTFQISTLAELAFSGFAYAHRAHKIDFDFTVDDVASWLIEVEGLANQVAERILFDVMSVSPSKKKELTKQPPKPIGKKKPIGQA